MRYLCLVGLAIASSTACVKHNPAACCSTLDECTSFGLDGITNCETSLVCDATGTCVSPQCGSAGDCPSGDECVSQLCVATSPSSPVCGNGIIEPGEVCDDGNTADGDGCSSDCQVAHCFVPVTHPTIAAAITDLSCTSIDVYSGTYSENLSISDSISITGVGASPSIIDGGQAGSVVTITAGTVTLASLTIQNGSAAQGGGIDNAGLLTLQNDIVHSNTAIAADGLGGGIYNSGSFLTLQNTTVTGNHASTNTSSNPGVSGAGIFSAQGMVTINNSSIENNDITTSGTAGVSALGGGIDVEHGPLQIMGTTLGSNSINLTGASEYAHGAGLYTGIDDTDEVAISNSMISDNSIIISGDSSQTAVGGGIDFEGLNNVTLLGTTVSGNNVSATTTGGSSSQASDGAGGLNIDSSNVSIESSTITNNTVTATASAGSTVAIASAGGIVVSGSSLVSCTQSTIANNTVTATAPSGVPTFSLGGGIQAGLGQLVNANVTINQSTVSGNQLNGGTAEGGGLYVLSGAYLYLKIVDSTFSGNSAEASGQALGGGIYVQAGSPDQTTIAFNSSTITSNTVTGTVSPTEGGGFLLDNTESGALAATLANTLLAGNSGTDADCATMGSGSTVTSSGYNLIGTLSGCPMTTVTGDQVGANPMLGPLANNGGPTFTHALLPGSTAIDTANPAGCMDATGSALAQDQRGQPRIDNGRCDIGAFEK